MTERETLNVAVGQRVKQVRREKGITIEALAEAAEISPQFLSEVERGRKSMTTTTLYNVAVALRISADFLLFGVGSADAKRSYAIESLATLTPQEREQTLRLLHSAARILEDLGDAPI